MAHYDFCSQVISCAWHCGRGVAGLQVFLDPTHLMNTLIFAILNALFFLSILYSLRQRISLFK
jgi:hypothetical protein